MQIEQHQGDINPSSAAATSSDTPVAHVHAALFPAQMALARWMYGGDVPHVYACTRSIGRAAWFTETQTRFQAWLDAGGFHQAHETDATDCAVQDESPSQHATKSAAANPAWYDVTRCRLVRDSDLAE